MSPTLRQFVTERANARCEYCYYPQSINDGVLHLDHIIPPRFGGTHTGDNRALACQHCNLRKRDKIGMFHKPLYTFGMPNHPLLHKV
jgi:5-methylcytosine-specific restriction endonuclease McrA